MTPTCYTDPVNAQRAREALHGTLLGGQPLRINQAQRKSRDGAPSMPRPGASAYGGSSHGPSGGAKPQQGFPYGGQGGGQPIHAQHAQPYPAQTSSIDDVRDSRGNAPTKNLFVAGKFMGAYLPVSTGLFVLSLSFIAGYGPGTSEAQIRQIFSQHSNVVGVVLKGNFTTFAF